MYPVVRPFTAGPGANNQASQPVAEKPTRVDEEAASFSSLVIVAPAAQQAAEDYCQDLPLHLCHGCDGCGMRCAEGVRMTHHEFLRVEEFLSSQPEEAARVQLQDKSIPGWPVTQYCQFRDTAQNRCSIYPVRPVVCRLFGHTEWLPCPIEIVPLRGKGAMDVYQRYSDQEVRTFDEWRRVRGELPQANEESAAD